jgi:glycosyltransferase involved in cell wall biosynthesis
MFTARSFTANRGDRISDFFDNSQDNEVNLTSSEPIDLAYVIYSVGYQNLRSKFNVERALPYEDAVRNIHALLTLEEPVPATPFSALAKLIVSRLPMHKSDARGRMRDHFRSMQEMTRGVTPENAPRRWFDTIATATDASLADLLEYIGEQIRKRNIFDIFRGVGSISSVYFLLAPYYISYKIFQETRNNAERIGVEAGDPPSRKIAHFTDTFYEINGVANTLKQMVQSSRRLGLDLICITCNDGDRIMGEKLFKPVAVYDLPEYPEQKLAVPPILEVLDYCYREGFSHIHSVTPGPVGFSGMIAAKVLKKPFSVSHHTAIPQYAGHVTDDALFEELGWLYLTWLYSSADRILVPSQAFKEDLLRNGIDEGKIVMMPRGVDTSRFRPKPWNGFEGRFRLIYVGRVSREKNIDILAEAFKLMARPDVNLTIVGDGAYRDELQEKLKGFEVTFTGYLEGDELIEAYHRSDLFVFPSTTDTFGNVILEAHACGIPTVVTDQGGPSENVVDGETGLVVKGDNVYDLKAGIESLLDYDKLKKMGEHARQAVANRTFDGQFRMYWDLFEQIGTKTP